jgi:glutathione S-transferase
MWFEMHVLYSFRRCPYAMRARLALCSSGIDYEHREIALKAKPAEMLQASPKGTVPVLCLSTGEVLEQSLDIMWWALRQHDPEAWLPLSPQAVADTQALVAMNDGAFKAHLDRYKYPQRFGLQNGEADRDQAATWLHTLNDRLQAHAFLAGERWGLLDACVAPFVRQFARTNRAWFEAQTWHLLARWLVAFENSEAMVQVMRKHPLWTPVA